jgi:hypothetical protein
LPCHTWLSKIIMETLEKEADALCKELERYELDINYGGENRQNEIMSIAKRLIQIANELNENPYKYIEE